MIKLVLLIAVSFTICFVGQANAGLCNDPECEGLNCLLYSILLGHSDCSVSQYRSNADPSCAALTTFVIPAPGPSLNIYGPPGIHFVPMASKYYLARMALALGSTRPGLLGIPYLCPGDSSKWDAMDLTTPWTGLDSAAVGKGQAWDWGFKYERIIRRDCPFPDLTFPASGFPYLCEGKAGSPGTNGESLGWLSYMPVLTDDATWTLFVNCWDPLRRDGGGGSNYARSWMVFSKTKTLPDGAVDLIRDRLVEIGFNLNTEFAPLTYGYPNLNTCGPYDFTPAPPAG